MFTPNASSTDPTVSGAGLRIGIGLSWLAIVAAEMLIGGVGIGFFIWDAWNSSRISDIIVALVYVGLVGFLLDRLIAAAQRMPAIGMAVAHPCDTVSLESAVEAAKMGFVKPILVGPAARVRAVAKEAGLDIAGFELVSSEHSHDSAAKAGSKKP